jgi:thymidylate synthase
MKGYLDLLKDVRDHGIKKEDRTGTCTISVFGRQMKINLSVWAKMENPFKYIECNNFSHCYFGRNCLEVAQI